MPKKLGYVMATLLVATLNCMEASAQTTPRFDSVQDIPAGALRESIERLAPAVREATLRQLNHISPPKADLNYLRAGPDGRLFYADPPMPAPKSNQPGPDRGNAVIGINPARAFTLHSRPGTARVVYLNFRGENVSGTAWNAATGRATHVMKPYSEDADSANFSQAELNTIAEVWHQIAEDYAPFKIDVTTERPASFGPNVGQILFSNRVDQNGFAIYNNAVGGVAYIDVWGASNFTYYQPALVFPEGVSGAKNLAEAASHELGHNMGLTHDAAPGVGYYSGHGSGKVSWGPIMGVGYYSNVSQWSKGEYPGANNTQDDIAIITNKLTENPDEHGGLSSNATPLAFNNSGVVTSYSPVQVPHIPYLYENRGILASASDQDTFSFLVSNAGRVDLTVYPSWRDSFLPMNLRASNLDIRATLLRGNGTEAGALVVQNDQAAETFARIVADVTPGRYMLRLESVGSGNLTTGYSDYGSLGRYSIIGRVPTPSLRSIVTTTPVPARGTVSGTGNYPVGTVQSVTATPNPGFQFVRWTNGGVQVATTRGYSFVLNAHTNLVAHFAATAPISQ